MSCVPARSEEVVHDTAAGRHEDAEPPPLVRAHFTGGAFEQDLVIQGQVTALRLASFCGGCNERVERGGGQHLRGRIGKVEGHERRAIGLVEVEALNLVVGIDGDLIFLWAWCQREGCRGSWREKVP
jgi:hypothetical protein